MAAAADERNERFTEIANSEIRKHNILCKCRRKDGASHIISDARASRGYLIKKSARSLTKVKNLSSYFSSRANETSPAGFCSLPPHRVWVKLRRSGFLEHNTFAPRRTGDPATNRGKNQNIFYSKEQEETTVVSK